jgi:hypothetical protein
MPDLRTVLFARGYFHCKNIGRNYNRLAKTRDFGNLTSDRRPNRPGNAPRPAAFTLDEAVAVYVPSTTNAVVRHIVLYLQGFRGVCGDTGTKPADVMNVFNLAEQAESSPDSVLVFFR